MKFVINKLRVAHYAQLPCLPFVVDVENEKEAHKICQVLADQHIFLNQVGIIPDYSNIISVLMWDDSLDGDHAGEKWGDYYNSSEEMDWDDFSAAFLEVLK